MPKLVLTAVLTAALCFAVASATGLGASSPRLYTLKVGDIASFPSDNFHCQALTTTQIACGAKLTPGSIQVYYAPTALEVLKFGSTLKKADVLLDVKR